jgi:hypothetical protein
MVRSTPAHHALVERLVFQSLTGQQVRQLGTISRRIAEAIDPSAPVWSPESSPTATP